MSRSDWTADDREERLKQMWIDGLSASQIARALGGVTRNAVLGKAIRLGLSKRAPRPVSAALVGNIEPEPMAPKKVAPAPAPRPDLSITLAGEPPAIMLKGLGRVTLLNCTSHQCRWPHGDPATREFHLCGHPQFTGRPSPYCEFHTAKAWSGVPASTRDRRKAKESLLGSGVARAFG